MSVRDCLHPTEPVQSVNYQKIRYPMANIGPVGVCLCCELAFGHNIFNVVEMTPRG